MMKSLDHSKIVSQLLDLLASEHRRVAATWRLWAYSTRLQPEYLGLARDDRRRQSWHRALVRNPHFKAVPGISEVYLIVAPYSDYLTPTEEQILQEANPWAVISHGTALIHHSLTTQMPSSINATLYRPIDRALPPLGLTPEEWAVAIEVTPRTPDRIGRTEIVWSRLSDKFKWGTEVAESNGVPIYVTDLERTLLDALRFPGKAGGILNTLGAWSLSRDKMDLDKLIRYTERFGIKLLRQRVGFILEEMNIHHPRISAWKHRALRGGSAKLVAGESFASRYSEAWNLSINVPPDTLSVLHE